MPLRSPCGRHHLELRAAALWLDGRRVHAVNEDTRLTAPPAWRGDGRAVAWLEQSRSGLRLVVVADVARPEEPLYWTLPARAATTSRERLSWVGPHQVVVGPDLLSPRAVASWTESASGTASEES